MSSGSVFGDPAGSRARRSPAGRPREGPVLGRQPDVGARKLLAERAAVDLVLDRRGAAHDVLHRAVLVHERGEHPHQLVRGRHRVVHPQAAALQRDDGHADVHEDVQQTLELVERPNLAGHNRGHRGRLATVGGEGSAHQYGYHRSGCAAFVDLAQNASCIVTTSGYAGARPRRPRARGAEANGANVANAAETVPRKPRREPEGTARTDAASADDGDSSEGRDASHPHRIDPRRAIAREREARGACGRARAARRPRCRRGRHRSGRRGGGGLEGDERAKECRADASRKASSNDEHRRTTGRKHPAVALSSSPAHAGG